MICTSKTPQVSWTSTETISNQDIDGQFDFKLVGDAFFNLTCNGKGKFTKVNEFKGQLDCICEGCNIHKVTDKLDVKFTGKVQENRSSLLISYGGQTKSTNHSRCRFHTTNASSLLTN